MNDLSWMLYLAGVIPSLGETMGVFAFICGVAFIATAIIRGSCPYPEDFPSLMKWSKTTLKVLPFAFVLCFLLSAFIPSQRTIYLIMGSELGEEVIQSETGKRVLDAVNKKLDEYLGVVEETASE